MLAVSYKLLLIQGVAFTNLPDSVPLLVALICRAHTTDEAECTYDHWVVRNPIAPSAYTVRAVWRFLSAWLCHLRVPSFVQRCALVE